jgi:CubicO group peptidase (beta-lactamase class C family)
MVLHRRPRRPLTPAGEAALALALATSPPAAAAAPDFAALDSAIVAEMSATATPGAAIAVVLGDSIAWTRGYGVASVETGEPVTPHTLFRVASTTKMLVAAAAASLAAQGRVDPDGPIAASVDGLDPALGRLTLHQLLAHTSGLSDESSYEGTQDEAALGAFVRSWGVDRLFAPPGAVYSYSNPGYALAGHVLAEAADTTFEGAMQRLVFGPLGMEGATTLPTMAMTYPVAQAHDLRPGPVVVRPYPDDARFRPNGGAFVAAAGFARFARAVLHGGRLDGRQTLPAGAVERLLAKHGVRPGGDPADTAHIAWGLVERRVRGVRMLQHGGTRLGAGSIVRFAPDHGFAVVILTNRTGSFLPQALERITALALPAGPAAPRPRAPAKPPGWTRGERAALAGTWVNRLPELALELFVERDTLRARRPGEAVSEPVAKIGARRYAFAGQELGAVPGPDGRPRFLHLGGRAFARVAP